MCGLHSLDTVDKALAYLSFVMAVGQEVIAGDAKILTDFLNRAFRRFAGDLNVGFQRHENPLLTLVAIIVLQPYRHKHSTGGRVSDTQRARNGAWSAQMRPDRLVWHKQPHFITQCQRSFPLYPSSHPALALRGGFEPFAVAGGFVFDFTRG